MRRYYLALLIVYRKGYVAVVEAKHTALIQP
jgi:hypothetical protein